MQRFLLCSQSHFSLLVFHLRSTLFHANSLNILLLANKLAGSAVKSNYHISFAAVESSQVMRIVPTVDQLEVEHPT
uniref:Putative ovule protein n=1 Tax=Solanum chacoense TaxID=4108 RepID=A0A0V0H0J8_SOLCH